MNKITKKLKCLVYKAFKGKKKSTEILKIYGNWFKTGGDCRSYLQLCSLLTIDTNINQIIYRLANNLIKIK